MNKKLLAAGLMAGVVLAGCQSITDQLGTKLAESVINSSTKGEVKVNLDDLKNGNINVTTKEGTMTVNGNDNGGKLTVTDKSGKTVVDANGANGAFSIKDESGKEVLKGDQNSVSVTDEKGETSTYKSTSGATRPADAPADLPTLDNGQDFGLFTVSDMTSLNYSVNSADLKGICDKQTEALTGAGWAATKDGFNVETEDSIARNYDKDGFTLLEACGVSDGQVTIALQKNKKTS